MDVNTFDCKKNKHLHSSLSLYLSPCESLSVALYLKCVWIDLSEFIIMTNIIAYVPGMLTKSLKWHVPFFNRHAISSISDDTYYVVKNRQKWVLRTDQANSISITIPHEIALHPQPLSSRVIDHKITRLHQSHQVRNVRCHKAIYSFWKYNNRRHDATL